MVFGDVAVDRIVDDRVQGLATQTIYTGPQDCINY